MMITATQRGKEEQKKVDAKSIDQIDQEVQAKEYK